MADFDRIAQAFTDKTILVTGVTGFVGKVLLEKILRSCSDFRKVYALVRNEEYKEAHLRLQEVFTNPLFRAFSDSVVFKKVETVRGDVASKGLGLESCDLIKLHEEVEIIYHCADVKFSMVKEAVCTNVYGTKQMLDLARGCKKLMVFVHVSSAFCHLNEILDESTVESLVDPHEVIKICEYFDWNVVEKIRKDLMGPFRDCYNFTKTLSETLVAHEMNDLPVIIVRPSVVVPTLKDPTPGYIDNPELLVAVGKGLIRTIYCKSDARLNCIPADILANFLLFSTFDYVKHRTRRIYNAVAPQEYTIKEVVETLQDVVQTSPFRNTFWYPLGSLTLSKTKHYVTLYLFQMLPALILDGILIMCRSKPRFMKIQMDALNMYALCERYVDQKFNCSQSIEAFKLLNDTEKKIYNLYVFDRNLRQYLFTCVNAAQVYFLHETNDKRGAQMQMKLMWCLHKLCQFLFIAGFFYCICVFL